MKNTHEFFLKQQRRKEIFLHEEKNFEINDLSPLILAYLGDAYFSLFVRKKLLLYETHDLQWISQTAQKFVSAVYQAKISKSFQEMMTEQELAIFRKGRNAHSHAPRVASVQEYHLSTAFEAVLGFCFFEKNFERLDFLCDASFKLMVAFELEDLKSES